MAQRDWSDAASFLNFRFGREKKRRHKRGAARAKRRTWSFEPLEVRTLLAIDLAARFEFADTATGGSTQSSLQVGHDYFLRMYVRDIRADPSGVLEAYYNISFNTSVPANVASFTGGTINHGSFGGDPSGTASGGSLTDAGGLDSD